MFALPGCLCAQAGQLLKGSSPPGSEPDGDLALALGTKIKG